MKNLFKTGTLLIFFFSVLLTGCKDDPEEPDSGIIAVKSAYFVNHGLDSDNDLVNLDLFLVIDGTVDIENEIIGGKFIYLEMLFPKNTFEVIEGTYYSDDTWSKPYTFTAWDGEWGSSIDITNSEGNYISVDGIVKGTVNVEKHVTEDKTFNTVRGTIETASGEDISFYFSGKMIPFEKE